MRQKNRGEPFDLVVGVAALALSALPANIAYEEITSGIFAFGVVMGALAAAMIVASITEIIHGWRSLS